MNNAREQLDRLLAFDAGASVIFGVLSLVAPHGFLAKLGGGFYNHDVHEILRCVPCEFFRRDGALYLLKAFAESMVVCALRPDGFYGMFDLSMTENFASRFAKPNVFVMFCRPLRSPGVSLLIDIHGLTGLLFWLW